MRILWMSNAPFVNSGYGSQTRMMLPRLRDAGHEVAVFCNHGLAGSIEEWEGFRLYPNSADSYGNELIGMWADHWFDGQPGQIITLYDVWALDPKQYGRYNVASWVPVDHTPVPPRVTDWFKKSGATPIAMSEFGRDSLALEELNPLYAPHGIDTDTFRPRDGKTARTRVGIGDEFLVGMVAANLAMTPRKSFDLSLRAFQAVREMYGDVKFYMHSHMTGRHGKAIELDVLATHLGISGDALAFVGDMPLESGRITDEAMSHIYSMMDVLIAPSMGEGFGIPVVEAQSCGVPVIVSDATAQSELCGAGWKTPCQPHYDPQQIADWSMPLLRELTVDLANAYHFRGDESLRRQAREFALGYDADRVFDAFWQPILKQLEANLVSTEPITV